MFPELGSTLFQRWVAPYFRERQHLCSERGSTLLGDVRAKSGWARSAVTSARSVAELDAACIHPHFRQPNQTP